MTAKCSLGCRGSVFFAPVLGAVILAAVLVSTGRGDWPHYLGPTQNGVASAGGATLPTAAPKVLWQAKLGKGTAGVTVSGNAAYSMGNVAGKDVIYCLDVKSGKELWKHEFPLKLDPNMFEGGPRATPTVDGDRVYTLSHEGDLWCLDAKTGKKLWYKHYQQNFGGRRPDWGYAGSPTVAGNMLICDVGGEGASTIALDKATGEIIWKSGFDKPGYASPVVGKLDGKQTVVVFKADQLVGYDLAKGDELWRTGWKTDYDVNAATPLLIGTDRIFISSGYNAGCELIQIQGGEPTVLWKNKNLRAHVNTPVPGDGVVYGIDGNTGGGNLVCLDLATGDRRWEEKSVKGGSLIRAGGKLIVLSEKGELVIADASPGGFKADLRTKVLDKRCWVQPTLSGGRLFVKSNEGDLVCLDFGAR